VGFDAEADTLTLTHSARSRRGFAEGALLAARWIAGRKGLYDFSEVFESVVQQAEAR
jgi:4-hydroxy-tetrahydrodipicolinate reductase